MKSVFIEKQKKLYKSIKSCYCKALQETVHFTADGLNHILYCRRRPRNHNEQHYRAGLIPHVVEVITNATKAIKNIKSSEPLIITWSLQGEVKVNGIRQVVKVILKKESAGRITFLSAMRKKHINNGDKTKTKKPRAIKP